MRIARRPTASLLAAASLTLAGVACDAGPTPPDEPATRTAAGTVPSTDTPDTPVEARDDAPTDLRASQVAAEDRQSDTQLARLRELGDDPNAPNAAVDAWKAFRVLAVAGTPDDESALIDEANDNVALDPARADRLLTVYGDALAPLHRAAETDRVDWGLDRTEGPNLLLRHLNGSRQAVSLLAVEAERAFARGEPQAGVNALLDGLAFAQHVARSATGDDADSYVIPLLVANGSDRLLADALARHLPAAWPDLSAETRDRVRSAADAIPGRDAFAAATRSQGRASADWVRAGGPNPQVLENTNARGGQPFAEADHDAMAETLDDPAARAREADAIVALAGAEADWVALPPADRDAARPALDARYHAASPLAGALVGFEPSPRVGDAADRSAVLGTMLRTGIAAVASGDAPAAVAASRDPAGDGPLEYEDLGGGSFRLASDLAGRDGQPVSLAFGAAE